MELFDEDGDGEITAGEFQKGLTMIMGGEPDAEEAAEALEAFAEADTDGSGTVSIKELKAVLK